MATSNGKRAKRRKITRADGLLTTGSQSAGITAAPIIPSEPAVLEIIAEPSPTIANTLVSTVSDNVPAESQGLNNAGTHVNPARFPMRRWQWGVVPLCVMGALLIAPSNNPFSERTPVVRHRDPVVSPVANQPSPKDTAGLVSPRRVGADLANEPGLASKQIAQTPQGIRLELSNSEQRAISAERSSQGLTAALEQANQKVAAQGRELEVIKTQLIEARKQAEEYKKAADLGVVEQAHEAAGREEVEASLLQSRRELGSERGRAVSALKDLETARVERDIAKQATATLTAVLEHERQSNIGLAFRLSAARRAIDLVKEKGNDRQARNYSTSKMSVIATAAKSSAQSDLPARKVRRKPREPKLLPDKVATVTLPQALLPSP